MKAAKTIILIILNIVGLSLAVSEGSTYFWANFLGLGLFGGSSYLMGLFRDPYEKKE